MKQDKVVRTVVVDCENCYKEETIEINQGGSSGPEIPEGWIEIAEGQPFNNLYQFCTPECFTEWHSKDKYERLNEYHDRLRARAEALRIEEGRDV